MLTWKSDNISAAPSINKRNLKLIQQFVKDMHVKGPRNGDERQTPDSRLHEPGSSQHICWVILMNHYRKQNSHGANHALQRIWVIAGPLCTLSPVAEYSNDFRWHCNTLKTLERNVSKLIQKKPRHGATFHYHMSNFNTDQASITWFYHLVLSPGYHLVIKRAANPLQRLKSLWYQQLVTCST